MAKFKIGDIVEFGGLQGVVTCATVEEGEAYPVVVEYDTNMSDCFTLDGRLYVQQSVPVLNLVRRPKRKVKKRYTGWINIDSSGDVEDIYTSEKSAKKVALSYEEDPLMTIKVTGEYEVEE